MSEGETAHVRVRRDATWQQIADGLVVSSDGTVRLRIVERTATGTNVTVSWANRRKDAEWEFRRLQERNTPAEIASGVEIEHGNRVHPEECILKNDVAEETEQATLIPDGGTVEGGTYRFPDLDGRDLWHLWQALKYQGRDCALGWIRANIAIPIRHQFDEDFDEEGYYEAALDHYVDADAEREGSQ